MMKGEMIAKLKFWFGGEYGDLFNKKYITEKHDDYVYIYKKQKIKQVL